MRTIRPTLLVMTLLAAACGIAPPTAGVQPEGPPGAAFPDFQPPALWFGSPAPPLTIDRWLRGEPVERFEPGHVYVIEFWATWCAPCIANFPHLSQVQQQHAGEATIIGVNIWERTDRREQRERQVAAFVRDRAQEMQYTVALEDGESMAAAWMDPAQRQDIPCAFIVDQSGEIAWIGHPAEIDEPLEAVLAGEFDTAAAAALAESSLRLQQRIDHVLSLLREGRVDQGYALAERLVRTDLANDLWGRNGFLQAILNNDDVAKDHEWLLAATADLVERSGGRICLMIDTQARAHFLAGNVERAIELERRAIEIAYNEGARRAYERRLAQYQDARASE